MLNGLTLDEVAKLQKQYGRNILTDDGVQHKTLLAFLARFKNPLVIVLAIAATLSLFFGDKPSFFIIITIILLSIMLDFANTFRSEKAAEELKEKVRVKSTVIRSGDRRLVNADELVPGDIVVLEAGKVIPADGVIMESKDLFANEASLTGESFPQAKPVKSEVYMGCGIVSGNGLIQISKTGKDTKFAHIAKALKSSHRPTEFEREIKSFSLLIVKITFALVIMVFLVNILFHRNVLESVLFSLALAVGLTPELLPLIINLNLTKGSIKMAKEGVIVKQLSAVQNFGSMDVLCTDKTGTLTEDNISLVKHLDEKGDDSESVLKLGYLVSLFSTSFENPLDKAVLQYEHVVTKDYKKIDEIPFDFERKREAVVVHHLVEKRRTLIVKGAPEAVLPICNKSARHNWPLKESGLDQVNALYAQLSKDGFRVLAIASKEIDNEKRYEPNDENNLTFEGFLAFLDPAKQSVKETLAKMEEMGITIKIITGDNAYVTKKIANDINLPISGVLSGDELAKMSLHQLASKVEETTIFARVNPEQKMTIIKALQEAGHVVGYMGDGINDAPSLRAADVSVSVENAVDVAKDAADFILLRKSLRELINGVAEGRRTFANTMKYLRMSLSSNFGNMFSMAGASLFLPFLPMRATQILLNNLLYDTSQFALPLDNVDNEEIVAPRTMSLKDIKKFMWSYGLLSSLFDFTTFGILILIFHTNESTFQAGWFLESIATQVLVVYIIRSRLLPFKQSTPATTLVLSTLLVTALAIAVVILPIRALFHFGTLSIVQIISLAAVVFIYLLSAQLIKRRVYGGVAE